MDVFTPLRLGVRITADLIRVATAVPRAALTVLGHHERSADPANVPRREGVGAVPPRPARAVDIGDVEVATAPPEPTSAAGASGGIAGTMAAPGAAAAAGAPDPTAARPTAAQRTAPGGERRTSDTRAIPSPREEPPELREPDPIVESEGGADPHAQIHVSAPWEGYDVQRALDIVARVRGADESTKAVVRLYEQTHKQRKSILTATGG